jgi:hypothetical protein
LIKRERPQSFSTFGRFRKILEIQSQKAKKALEKALGRQQMDLGEHSKIN